jgi:hypothetical protein
MRKLKADEAISERTIVDCRAVFQTTRNDMDIDIEGWHPHPDGFYQDGDGKLNEHSTLDAELILLPYRFNAAAFERPVNFRDNCFFVNECNVTGCFLNEHAMCCSPVDSRCEVFAFQ